MLDGTRTIGVSNIVYCRLMRLAAYQHVAILLAATVLFDPRISAHNRMEPSFFFTTDIEEAYYAAANFSVRFYSYKRRNSSKTCPCTVDGRRRKFPASGFASGRVLRM